MMYCGNKAKVFVDGKWSAFMGIEEAKRLERQSRVEQMAEQLRAGKTVMALRGEQVLLDAARKAAAK